MKIMMRGLLAATAFISIATVAYAQDVLLIGHGFQPSAVQAALGLVIVLLVSLHGRERHVSTTI